MKRNHENLQIETPTKRLRTVQDRDDSFVDSIDRKIHNNDEFRSTTGKENSPHQTNRISDDGDDEVDDEKLTTENPSNHRSLPTPINQPGKQPDAGIISRIYVENFMCHRKLRIDLCSNVNFIHGQNGSGKSAILAALQICLGAGARRTHRARNLKDLVRKESQANYAKVQVTLLNKGPDAFKHDVFGDSITIERTISLGGSYNGYKLLGTDGKEKSRSKKELVALLDQLNIQVENPVAVLDQEEAKKFLMGKPEDKYDFFMKATELERLDRSYAYTKDKIYEMEDAISRMKNHIKPLSENVKKLYTIPMEDLNILAAMDLEKMVPLYGIMAKKVKENAIRLGE